eukprot:1757731-Pleurochrysis_carterae.AAC.1
MRVCVHEQKRLRTLLQTSNARTDRRSKYATRRAFEVCDKTGVRSMRQGKYRALLWNGVRGCRRRQATRFGHGAAAVLSL